MTIRTSGLGYDSHRLVEGRPLILGGVTIPSDRGPQAHSDGDAIAHAVTDALLGAASLGDIGTLFPDSDPRWKDADSIEMLGIVRSLLGERGFRPVHVDLTVILERPKLGPHRSAIQDRLGWALGLPPEQVSVKAKTNEGMGFVGRGEGIAVFAVATIERG